MTTPFLGGGFSHKQRRENIQRCLEESRTERKDRRADMTRARESGEWERVVEIARRQETENGAH